MRSMLPWNFSKSDHANKASSNVTLQPEPSLAHSPERVSWSKNPDEIDEEFPRDGPAAPRRHSATPQQQQHQQPTTPSQATPVPYEAQRNTAAHATPTTPVPRQIPGFFAVVPSPSPRDMQRQTSTSSVLSGNSSAGSGSLPPASFFISDQKTADPGDVFGEDYVARVKEVFYIREKPTVPQATDGVIRSPAMGGRQHDFHDAFKIDFGARSLTLQDLPSKVPILTIKKRAMMNVFNIFAGGSTNSSQLTAVVKKTSSTKLSIVLDKHAHIKYEAEGSFSDFVYQITRSGERVAQVIRDDNARAAVTSRHAYGVHVAPGTDCALMIAITLVAEEVSRVGGH